MGTETHDHDETVAAATTVTEKTDDSADFALGPSTMGTWSSRASQNQSGSTGTASTDRPALSSVRPKLSEAGVGGGSGGSSGFGGGGSGFHRDHSFGRDHSFHRDRSDRGDAPRSRPAITRGPPCDLRATGGDTEKHALEHAWVLWFDNPQRQKEGGGTWFENLAQVAIFNTVEDFWAIMNHIRNPNDLDNGANYHFFKEGVKPMWEDEANKGGGKWVVTLWDETQRVDTMWEALLLGMIGEMLGSDDIVDTVRGAVISKRKAVKAQKKGPRICLWLGKMVSDEAILAVGQRMREALNLPQHIELEFQLHEDAEQAGHSYNHAAKLAC